MISFTKQWKFWLVMLDFTTGTSARYTIEEIGTINTLKNLHQFYNTLPKISTIKRNPGQYASIGFFRKHIKPAWEDSANENGASYQFIVNDICVNEVWRNLLLAACSNELNNNLRPREDDGICGLMVSPKKEKRDYEIGIWVKSSSYDQNDQTFVNYICQIVNSAHANIQPANILFEPHHSQ